MDQVARTDERPPQPPHHRLTFSLTMHLSLRPIIISEQTAERWGRRSCVRKIMS